ncbi:MAG TPA: COX15/CtaA family protein, partial [Candidatus Berkiella sp.]|nr:COX15/CtaA family protein [Candidatus Berkiella sp.]
PGCYGQLAAPETPDAIQKANEAYPTMPVDVAKAQTEMTHRYFAESLGLMIVILALIALFTRKKHTLSLWLPGSLVLLIIFQGLLGMWTVTMRLFPLAVMGHLLGGFCTLGLLWLCVLTIFNKKNPATYPISPGLSTFATLLIVFCQILLGGWTSANYAALICPDFPTCQGHWWPNTHFSTAFNFLGGIDMDNPLAFQDTAGRTTIHVMHRLGALITLIFSILLIRSAWRYASLRKVAGCLALFLGIQLALGISNIVFSLPLHIAVAHNGMGALLL